MGNQKDGCAGPTGGQPEGPGRPASPCPLLVSCFSRLPCGISLTPENMRPRGTVLPPSPGLGQGAGRAVGADALCPPRSVAPGLECRSAGGPGLGLDAPPGYHACPSELGWLGPRRQGASVSWLQ